MTDILCKYMVSCVHHKILDIKDLCHAYYNVETFGKAYSEVARLYSKVLTNQ